MARPERLCRAHALPPSGSLRSFEIRSRRICRTLSFELSGVKFPVPSIHSGRHYRMARPERFELPTARFVAGYSIQLSYGRAVFPTQHYDASRGVRIIRAGLLIVNHSRCSSLMIRGIVDECRINRHFISPTSPCRLTHKPH